MVLQGRARDCYKEDIHLQSSSKNWFLAGAKTEDFLLGSQF